MKKQIVIIGAVALGPKVACRVKRLDPDAVVTVIDKSELISYGGCGIPYYVSGEVTDIKGLFSTSAHIERNPVFFKNAKGVDIKNRTEAISIDRKMKQIKTRNCDNGEIDTVSYDTLVLATGATPVLPPVKGRDLDGVSVVANLIHAQDIKHRLSKGLVNRAVVIGGVSLAGGRGSMIGVIGGVLTIGLLGRILPLIPGVGQDEQFIIRGAIFIAVVGINMYWLRSSGRDDA